MKQWIITPRTHDDLITELLARRGVTAPLEQAAFLTPDFAALHDPLQLKDMDRTLARLQQAIAQKEKIAIFGDYDHDGTPAAALLADGIRRCGGEIAMVYIPTREEGYSISKSVIDVFVQNEISLLVTVDCGITNKPEIDYAKEQGIETIVIDHHVVQDDKFPDAAIVVNPKQAGDSYPFKELCGCGLAYKVIQALGASTGKISAGEMKWYLDLVAISTICDMVPLVGENRILVHYGLIVLSKTRRLGLQALYQAAAIDPETMSTYTVGFGIGPRLNAPGRMAQASIAYELLIADDELRAKELGLQLEQLNKQRQQELENVLASAEAAVKENNLYKKKVILVAGEGWADGVVGLVAGRLMDRYSRPTIVLSKREDGLAKGSARSVEKFHLVEALQLCEQRLTKFGGHARAAGLTLAQDQLENFYDELIEIADQQLDESDLVPHITIDAVLSDAEVNLTTAENLAKLEPHGFSNPKPIVMLQRATVVSAREIGSNGKHLKLLLRLENGEPIDAIAFGMANRQAECPVDAVLDLVGTLDINEWKGRRSVQLKVSDWRSSVSEAH